MIALLILGCLAWAASGIAGFRYWWAHEFGWDDLPGLTPQLLLGGICGPCAWGIGAFIHGRG